MQYFIGIVPPDSICEKINRLRQEWGYKATEPHITIKASGGLHENNDWLTKVSKVIANYRAFDILVDGVDHFSNSVIFYRILSEQIIDLHMRLVEAVSPTDEEIKAEFASDLYIPHLTIMKHKKGYKNLPLQQIALESNKILREKYMFKAHSVRIYGRNNQSENYERILDLPLS